MEKKRFRSLYIEITNVCNLSCPFCPGSVRAPAFMTPDEFFTVAQKTAGISDYYYLHVLGEPLLNPHFAEILSIADKLSLNIKLTTNGTLLNDNLKTILSRGCVKKVNISLTCLASFNSPADKISYLDSALCAADALSANKKPVSLRYWLGNADGFEYVKDAVNKKYGAQIKAAGGALKIKNNLIFDFNDKFDWPVSTYGSKHKSDARCLGLIKQLAVLCDGTVSPCCLCNDGQITLGNIFESTPEEILNSPRAKKILEGFSQNKAIEPFCRTCTFKERLKKTEN